MIQALALLTLTGIVPGLALAVLTRLLRPGTSAVGLAAAATGWGLTCWLVTAGVLVRTTGLDARACWIAGTVTAVPSLVLLALPRSWRTLRGEGRETLWSLAAVALGAVAWLPVGIIAWRMTWAPIGSTSWYYWGLAQQTAAAGRLPETSVEFGSVVPFLSDYPLFTAATAALVSVGPEDQADLVRLVVTTVPVLLAALGSALLPRAFGVGRLAALVAAPLGVGTGVAAYKLTAYRPEGFAIGCLLVAVALVAVGLAQRDVHLLAPGVAATAVVSQVHGIALVTAAALLVAAGVVAWVRDRTWRTALVVAGSGAAVAVVVGLLALLMGRLSGSTHGGGLSGVGGLADPTYDFTRAARGRPPGVPPDRSDLLARGFRGVYHGDSWWYAAIAAVCLLLVLVAVVVRGRLGALAGFVVLSLLGLAVPVGVFLLGWESYVPRRTGTARIIAESSVLLPVLVAGAAAAVHVLLDGERRRRVVATACVGVVLAASAGAGALASWRLVDQRLGPRVAREDVQALRDLDLPADSVVLTDGYSEGIIHSVTGAHGLIEGRAPYTFPDVLARANELLRGAAEFYRRPRASTAFLDDNDVDYVIVQTSRALTGSYRFRAPQALELLRMGRAFEEVLTMPHYSVFRYEPEEIG